MGIMRSRSEPSGLGDAELIQRSRSGDRNAFGELWRRHSRAGVTVARSYTSTFDPEDLVAESYAKIFQAIQSGGGPTGAFRPYLFTTIRNTAASWGRAKRETAIEDADQIEDPQFSEENTLAALDRSLTARAFQSLPTRWQEALWYSEVESMTPQEIAPLLGMKANGVAALTYRAREGLRQAWIQAHLSSLPADSECRWSIDHLGAYARDGLSKRDTARVDHHLSECAKCTIVAAEAKEVGSRLTLVLLPLAAGLAGATGYAAWLQSGSHAAAYATGSGGVVMPAAAVGGGALGGAGGVGGAASGAGAGGAGAGAGAASAGVAASAGAAGVSGVVIGSVVAGVLVAAAAVTAILVAPMVFNNSPAQPQNEAAPPAATSTPTPDSSSSAAPTALPTAPTAPAVPPTVAASADSAVAAPVLVLPGSPTTAPVAVPAPPAAPSAPTIGTASISPTGSLSLTGAGVPGNTVIATAQSVSGGGGGAARFAVVPSALEIGRTNVGGDGTWSITADLGAKLPNGTYTFTVVQSGVGGDSAPTTTKPIALSVVPSAPVITSPKPGATINSGPNIPTEGTGIAGNVVKVALTQNGGDPIRSADATVGSDGTWNVNIDIGDLPNGTYTLSVIQIRDGVSSAAATLTVTIAIPPAAPAIVSVDTGVGLYYPIVSGTGTPGGTVTISALDDHRSAPITVNADGTWVSPQLDWQVASVTATVTVDGIESAPSVSRPVEIGTPTLSIRQESSGLPIDQGFLVDVTGQADAPFALFANGGPWLQGLHLDASGQYSSGVYTWFGHSSADTLGIRYGTPDRYGPTISIPFEVSGAPALSLSAAHQGQQLSGVPQAK